MKTNTLRPCQCTFLQIMIVLLALQKNIIIIILLRLFYISRNEQKSSLMIHCLDCTRDLIICAQIFHSAAGTSTVCPTTVPKSKYLSSCFLNVIDSVYFEFKYDKFKAWGI